MIFLDTDIISFYHFAVKNVVDKVNELLDNNKQICITVINKYEILRGHKWKENKQKEHLFRMFMADCDIFTIDDLVIEIASDIYADLRKKGITIDEGDILIAAIVIANNGTLVTNNTKHFENIEQLRVVNWL